MINANSIRRSKNRLKPIRNGKKVVRISAEESAKIAGGYESMIAREPTIIDLGICLEHDQRCAVLPGESAVISCNTGIFHPSWKAQLEGWRLVQARNRWQRFLLRVFFGARC